MLRFQDFAPKQLIREGLFRSALYETFEAAVAAAGEWATQQQSGSSTSRQSCCQTFGVSLRKGQRTRNCGRPAARHLAPVRAGLVRGGVMEAGARRLTDWIEDRRLMSRREWGWLLHLLKFIESRPGVLQTPGRLDQANSGLPWTVAFGQRRTSRQLPFLLAPDRADILGRDRIAIESLDQFGNLFRSKVGMFCEFPSDCVCFARVGNVRHWAVRSPDVCRIYTAE